MSIMLLYTCSPPAKQGDDEKKSAPKISQITSPALIGSEEPYLFSSEDGTVYLSWINAGNDTKHLRFSRLDQDQWTEPRLIASGSDWFVNWADFPAIGVNNGQNMMAHFLAKSGESTYAYDVNVTFSTDAGTKWSEPKVLHDDGIQAEHGFASIVPFKENFFVTWLDGRYTADKKPMTIRGAIVNASGDKLEEWELDDRVCDCCQTGAAVTTNGPIVVYRDRSEEEIRDMSIVRFVNGSWTAPQIIFADNWKIAGCPVNGPKASAIGNNLVIAWFSAPEGGPQVNLVFSSDGGATFDQPIRIDEGSPIGRVDVELLNAKTAFVSWMEGSDIKAVSVTIDGKVGDSIPIASSSESRSSGFPHIARSGNKLIIAWTELTDESKIVKTARLDI